MPDHEQNTRPKRDTLWSEPKCFFPLFCLIDIPAESLSRILDEAESVCFDPPRLWLVDSYATIPKDASGYKNTPVDENWKSPFIGKSISDAAAFLKAAPAEERDRGLVEFSFFFVVDDLYHYKNRRLIKVCHIGDEKFEEGELSWAPGMIIPALMVMTFMYFDRWVESVNDYIYQGWYLGGNCGVEPMTPVIPPEPGPMSAAIIDAFPKYPEDIKFTPNGEIKLPDK